MTYNLNKSTLKIELHFEKSFYMGLPEADKKEIKSTFLWSNFNKCWVSRALHPNTYRAESLAKKFNFVRTEDIGEDLSFAQRIEEKQERAEARAERFEARAEKAAEHSTQAWKAAGSILSFIPPGQPILVGHHSEGRHRRDLQRSDNLMRKSCQESDKAKYYEGRAQSAQCTAEGAQLKNVNYLLNRIAECKTRIRELDRYLAGINLVNPETHQRGTKENPLSVSDSQRERWTGQKNEQLEKLDFFTAKLQEAGGGQLTAERIKEGKPAYVKVGGDWWPLKSINRDTVTVLNWLGIAGFTWKYKFDQIKSMQSINGTVVVFDRDGKQVLPTIKYK